MLRPEKLAVPLLNVTGMAPFSTEPSGLPAPRESMTCELFETEPFAKRTCQLLLALSKNTKYPGLHCDPRVLRARQPDKKPDSRVTRPTYEEHVSLNRH